MSYEAILKTDSKGNIMIYNKGHWQEYYRSKPNRTFKIIVEEISDKTSSRLQAYFNVEILPKYIIGYRSVGYNYTPSKMKEVIRETMPVFETKEEIEGEFKKVILDYEDLNYFKWTRLIDELIIFAAENLQIEIQSI